MDCYRFSAPRNLELNPKARAFAVGTGQGKLCLLSADESDQLCKGEMRNHSQRPLSEVGSDRQHLSLGALSLCPVTLNFSHFIDRVCVYRVSYFKTQKRSECNATFWPLTQCRQEKWKTSIATLSYTQNITITSQITPWMLRDLPKDNVHLCSSLNKAG